MKKILLYRSVFILLLIPLLSGCFGYNTITKSQPFENSSNSASRNPTKDWKNIPIFEDDELLLDPYQVVAKITVTGNQNSLDKKLIKKMQQEASKYHADAIIFKNWKEVERRSVNGVAIGVNILTLVTGGYMDLEMGGDYIAYEYEGIAIQFLNKKKKISKKDSSPKKLDH